MIVYLCKTRIIFISYQVALMKSGNMKMRNISTELKFLLQTPLMLQLSQLETNSHLYQLHPDRDAGRFHHGRMDTGHGHANKIKLEQINIASKEQQVIESMKRR